MPELKLNTIHNIDCVAGMQKLDAESVDLAFADPPFNIGYDYDVYDDRKERDHYLDWSRQWITGVHHALKPTGTFWLAIGDEYAAELKILSQEIGFHCRSWVIWYYTFGVNCKMKFSRSHAHLFHFVKDAKKFTFNFNDKAIRIPSARQLVYADDRANPNGRLPDDTWILRPQDVPEGFRADDDTWYFPRVAGTFKERAGFHGCQMPEQLLGRIIRASSNESDPPELVLDPFSGSATTLVVAKKLNRNFVGFDLSADYVERGRKRLAGVNGGDPLEGAAEPLLSAPATPGQGRAKKAAEPALRDEIQVKADANPIAASRSKSKVVERASKAREAQLIPQTHTRSPLTSKSFSAVIEAFRKCHNGYSADRVIADPELNEQFVRRCERLGLEGTARDWNHALFGMRKSGKLASVATSRSTVFDWDLADRFVFASEIALNQIEENSISLDQALCDPVLANQFDSIAASFASGFSPFQYRWAALRIRKDWHGARSKPKNPVSLTEKLHLDSFCPEKLTGVSGAYLLSSARTRSGAIYAGDTLDIGNLCTQILDGNALRDVWRKYADDLYVWFCRHNGSDGNRFHNRFARSAGLVAQYEPKLNYRPLNALQQTVA